MCMFWACIRGVSRVRPGGARGREKGGGRERGKKGTYVEPLKVLVRDVDELLGPLCALGQVRVLGAVRLREGEERDGRRGEGEEPGDVLARQRVSAGPRFVEELYETRPLRTYLFHLPEGVYLPRGSTGHPDGVDIFGRPLVRRMIRVHVLVCSHLLVSSMLFLEVGRQSRAGKVK